VNAVLKQFDRRDPDRDETISLLVDGTKLREIRFMSSTGMLITLYWSDTGFSSFIDQYGPPEGPARLIVWYDDYNATKEYGILGSVHIEVADDYGHSILIMHMPKSDGVRITPIPHEAADEAKVAV
jgi:hypothetical protein